MGRAGEGARGSEAAGRLGRGEKGLRVQPGGRRTLQCSLLREVTGNGKVSNQMIQNFTGKETHSNGEQSSRTTGG